MAAMNPGYSVGVFKIVISPDFGQIVGLSQIDVAAHCHVWKAEIDGILGRAQESSLRRPVVVATDRWLVQCVARKRGPCFIEERRREQMNVSDAGEQAEGVVGGSENCNWRALEGIERLIAVPQRIERDAIIGAESMVQF